jgi:hypothetical protein
LVIAREGVDELSGTSALGNFLHFNRNPDKTDCAEPDLIEDATGKSGTTKRRKVVLG